MQLCSCVALFLGFSAFTVSSTYFEHKVLIFQLFETPSIHMAKKKEKIDQLYMSDINDQSFSFSTFHSIHVSKKRKKKKTILVGKARRKNSSVSGLTIIINYVEGLIFLLINFYIYHSLCYLCSLIIQKIVIYLQLPIAEYKM